MDTSIDFAGVYQALPVPIALLTPDLVIADVNEAYEAVSGRDRKELIGRVVVEMFPDNPVDPHATGTRNLRASLQRVLDTAERDTMALQRYDVEVPGRPGVFGERYWSPVNAPVRRPDGSVALIIHGVEEVTGLIRQGSWAGNESHRRWMEAELFARSQELQQLNERLREARARDREVALVLQKAMLPVPVEHEEAAVRYLPAASDLQVCGDWYDVTSMPGDRIAVAVGDVAGHGLEAAGVMGQLRSALCAAVQITGDPARALEAAANHADSLPGAELTTALQAIVNCRERTITYSCAGHMPAALLRGDGTVEFLDQATDPPLATVPPYRGRPQATLSFSAGDTLVLYTDGLVERRGEDVAIGLSRLSTSLAGHRGRGPETIADALLADLAPPKTTEDDIALLVLQL